jgi:hypothetical protein
MKIIDFLEEKFYLKEHKDLITCGCCLSREVLSSSSSSSSSSSGFGSPFFIKKINK